MSWLIWLIPCFLMANVDQLLKEMSVEEKVGQLFIAPICPLRGPEHFADWAKLMESCHIGGAILKQADPASQIRQLNALQRTSKLPLLVVADAEWGLAMRMSQTVAFPKNMTLGAVQDLTLIEAMGREIGRQARLVGIHMNLAPVVDVNNNPKNPIIHMRSFGARPDAVATRAQAIIRGMQAGGLLTCAKHFPGHGDTGVDSHVGLPVINHLLARLESVELFPFRAVLNKTDAVMSAHLLVPALDPKWPATLSSAILTDLLRGELQFKGLILTDAMNMRAITDQFGVAPAACQAHCQAGADLLLYGTHVSEEVDRLIRDSIPASVQAIVAGYKKGEWPMERLDASVRRILQAKEDLGLFVNRLTHEEPDLHPSRALRLKRRLFEEALTWVGSGDRPVVDKKTAYLGIGNPKTDVLAPQFTQSLVYLADATPFDIPSAIEKAPHIVVALRCIQPRAIDYGISDELAAHIRALSAKTHVTVCLFGTPYALDRLPFDARVLVAYEDDELAARAAWKLLRGKPGKGQLPVER